MPPSLITKTQIEAAHRRIEPFITRTPLVSIEPLNEALGHKLWFKLESEQQTGSFKVRGALSALTALRDEGNLPDRIVAYSTGNHGLALAWAGRQLGVKKVRIYLPLSTSEMKKKAPPRCGAEVIITETRQEAEERSFEDALMHGFQLISPSDNDNVIAGAGTVLLEALEQFKAKTITETNEQLDATFIAIGGGSLSSGTVATRHHFCPHLQVFAGEPLIANDAATSRRTGSIFRFKTAPSTVADGATALGIAPRIFEYVKQLDGIYEIEEDEILYWATWFSHLSGFDCEPTAALSVAAAARWLKQQPTGSNKQALVVISGGNLLPDVRDRLYSEEFLKIPPQHFKTQ